MLTHDDLNKLADRIEARVDSRCDRIDTRLDVLNGSTGKAERDIAVLQDRSALASAEGKSAGAKWGAGAGAAIGGAILAVYKLLMGGP
jgi:hypothetical protein